jgi:hypothetical protein
MRVVAVYLLGVAVFSLLVSWLFIKRHQMLAKIALKTPIYIHPSTKVVLEDTASRVTFSSERSLNRGQGFFFLALFAFIGAIMCSFGESSIWAGQFASKVISIGLVTTLVLCVILGGLGLFFIVVAYGIYFNRIGKVEHELMSKRERLCGSCRKPFSKYVMEVTDFLNDVELAEYHAGKLQCVLDSELCSRCSFPLTRQTLNLRLSPIMRDESVKCPQCKNYTFTQIKVSDPVRAEQIGEAGYKVFERRCNGCGHQVQRQPRITLSSLEPAIKSAVNRHSQGGWERYCLDLKSEIELMIQCDETGKDRFKQKYKLVNATYFSGDATPSLRELKYLSTDDRRKAIKLLLKYVQERRDWEADPRNSNYGPD